MTFRGGRVLVVEVQIAGARRYRLPALVWPEGIDENVSDWARDLVVSQAVAASTAEEYVKILKVFREFCRRVGRAWDTIDDALLVEWRDEMAAQKGLQLNRIRACLGTVFRFYVWAETTGRLRGHVGIYESAGPVAGAKKRFSLTAKKVLARGKGRRHAARWTSTVAVNRENCVKSRRERRTPTDDDVVRIHDAVNQRSTAERDSLIFSWAEETGLRRGEILRITCRELPSLVEIAALMDEGKAFTLEVLRKGGRMTFVQPPLDLLMRTADYIAFEREEIVRRFYRDRDRRPDELFLSKKTGRVLSKDSVTKIGHQVFSKAGVSEANIHRLRAKFAKDGVEAMLDAAHENGHFRLAAAGEVETIATRAAEAMGHANPASLKPYLNGLYGSRARATKSHEAHQLAATLRQLRAEEKRMRSRLASDRELLRARGLESEGRWTEAAEVYRAIADAAAVQGGKPQRKDGI